MDLVMSHDRKVTGSIPAIISPKSRIEESFKLIIFGINEVKYFSVQTPKRAFH